MRRIEPIFVRNSWRCPNCYKKATLLMHATGHDHTDTSSWRCSCKIKRSPMPRLINQKLKDQLSEAKRLLREYLPARVRLQLSEFLEEK